MSYSCVRTYGTNVMKDYPIYYDMWVVGEACVICLILTLLFGFAVNLVSYGKFHSLSTCTRLCVWGGILSRPGFSLVRSRALRSLKFAFPILLFACEIR